MVGGTCFPSAIFFVIESLGLRGALGSGVWGLLVDMVKVCGGEEVCGGEVCEEKRLKFLVGCAAGLKKVRVAAAGR